MKERLPRILLPPILYGVALAFLLYLSWMRWPDPWVDFGFFLYNSWRLSEGAKLGIDLTYHYGPLAVHFYALLFKAFGPSIVLVFACNFALLLLDVVLIHKIFARESLLTAVLATLSFILIFSLGQYLFQGNYNLLGSYKPEIPLGTSLILALVFFCQRRMYPELIGLLAGLLLLTSTEFALAALAVCAVYVASSKPRLKELGKTILVFGITLVVACLFFGSYAFRTLQIFGNQKLIALPLLAHLMGTDLPLLRITQMLEATGYGIALAILFAVAGARQRWPLLLACIGFVALLAWLGPMGFWVRASRPFTFISVFGLALWLQRRERFYFLGLWSAFSLALLLRILLNPIFHYYGFTLALPGALLLIYLFTKIAPEWIESKGYSGLGLKVFACILFGAITVVALKLEWPLYKHRNFIVSSGKDPLYDWNARYNRRGPAIRALLEYLRENTKDSDSILGLPDGHIVNYLLKRRRPEPYSLSPGDLTEFGEEKILASYQASKPNYIFISLKEAYDDAGGFGETYGQSIFAWVKSEYKPVKVFENGKIILFAR